jgi:hypothetical protein
VYGIVLIYCLIYPWTIMKNILLLSILFLLMKPAFADFAKGLDAAQKEDYATAL